MKQTQTGRSNKRKREMQSERLADVEAGGNKERKNKKGRKIKGSKKEI